MQGIHNTGYAVGAFFCLLIIGCAGVVPSDNALQGKLSPCPPTPNCVSSRSHDNHAVDPLIFKQPLPEAVADMKKLILAMKRTKLTLVQNRYLRAEFRSALFQFVDDVEFLFDEADNTIHIRSASRVGYWDLGVNRRRVSEIRRRWEELPE